MSFEAFRQPAGYDQFAPNTDVARPRRQGTSPLQQAAAGAPPPQPATPAQYPPDPGMQQFRQGAQQRRLPSSQNTGFTGYGGMNGGGMAPPSLQTPQGQIPGSVPGSDQPGQGGAMRPWEAALPTTWTPESIAQFIQSNSNGKMNASSPSYWMSKEAELDARGRELGNPNYKNDRLAAADEIIGGPQNSPYRNEANPLMSAVMPGPSAGQVDPFANSQDPNGILKLFLQQFGVA